MRYTIPRAGRRTAHDVAHRPGRQRLATLAAYGAGSGEISSARRRPARCANRRSSPNWPRSYARIGATSSRTKHPASIPGTSFRRSQAGWALRKPLRHALAAAKIAKRFTVHGFRRTANNLLRQVSTAVVTQAVVGHATDAMHAHYSRVESAEKKAAMRRVVALWGGPLGNSLGNDNQPPSAKSQNP